MKINILHVSKTGGSYLKEIIANNADLSDKFVIHDHHIKASNLAGKPYLLVLRNPSTRFFSAFYSRRRMGQPKYFRLWNVWEMIVFYYYKTPETFLEKLIGGSIAARFLVKRVRHIRDHQSDWLDDDDNPPVALLRQEHLDGDFAKLVNTLFPGVNFESQKREHSNKLQYEISAAQQDYIYRTYSEDHKRWKALSD